MITINDQNSRLHLVACNRNQNSRLHLIACNRNERSALHALHASHVISCIILRHFMLYFTSFHVAFNTFHCTHCMHHTHITHVTHFAFHEQRGFQALHHIARHFMYHFMSFYHENSQHTHSWHLELKREEIGSKHHTLQQSASQVRRSNQEDKNAT